jgi:hypothetical protein
MLQGEEGSGSGQGLREEGVRAARSAGVQHALQAGLDFGPAPNQSQHGEAFVSVAPDYGESISRATSGALQQQPAAAGRGAKSGASVPAGADGAGGSPVLSEQLLSAHSAALDSAAVANGGGGGAHGTIEQGLRLPADVPRLSEEGGGLFDDDEEDYGSPTAELRAASPLKSPEKQ